MKILVMIKQVPDTATQIKIGPDPKAIDTTGITWIVSPYDEYALEEGLRIKEKRGQGEVVAVSLGPDRVKEALRSCLAMGADRAIHLNDPAWEQADTLMTARALAAVIKQEAPGLTLRPEQLEGLPAELLRELRQAVIELDTARTHAIIEQVTERDASLGRALNTLATQLGYRRLLKLLERVHSRSGQTL
jgi:electron transfer flavoprotein alpha subunit